MTAALVAAGVPIAKAEAAVRLDLGMPTAPSPESPARDNRVLEKEEQRRVVKRFRVCGFGPYNLSQARASKQTPRSAASIPTRNSTSPPECVRCGVAYATGDRYDAERWLVEHELAAYAGGVFEPLQGSQ